MQVGQGSTHKVYKILTRLLIWVGISTRVLGSVWVLGRIGLTGPTLYPRVRMLGKPNPILGVVPPPQENMNNSPSLFDYGLDNPYNNLIDDFDSYLEYGNGYQNRMAFKDAFYK